MKKMKKNTSNTVNTALQLSSCICSKSHHITSMTRHHEHLKKNLQISFAIRLWSMRFFPQI